MLKSEGNFNNHFGLPLMLLKLEPEHDIAVIEMGMSHAGEIAALAKIAQPEIGVVTNVAPVHLEFFNSVADIARAKYELIASLPAGGTAILNADDEYVSQFGRDFHGKVVLYGMNPSADVRAENMESRGTAGSAFDVVAGGCRDRATLPLVGVHNVYNALAAVAVGLERGLTPSEAVGALATLTPADKTRGGRPTRQHHGHQRLLQFQSKGPRRNGRYSGRDAGQASHCGGRRDAGIGPGRRRDASAIRAAYGRAKDRLAARGAGLGAGRWSRLPVRPAFGPSLWPRRKRRENG